MSGLLAVHAHPDDETITQGATLAGQAAAGLEVAVVTCTRGEQGEVIPAELAHLAGTPGLAPVRVAELAAALAELGVRRHRFLDGDREPLYRDSGMAYAGDGSVVPLPQLPPGAFVAAPVPAAAQRLAQIIRHLRPDVVTTYGPDGGYGHPDHVRVHEVVMAAVRLAPVRSVYWISTAGEATDVVDGSAHLERKRAALRAHATQVLVADDGASYALSNGVPVPLSGVEHYRLAEGYAASPGGPRGLRPVGW